MCALGNGYNAVTNHLRSRKKQRASSERNLIIPSHLEDDLSIANYNCDNNDLIR